MTNLGYDDVRIDEATFHATDDFIPSSKMPAFDFIIAQSLFTHLPLDYFGKALDNLHATPPCKFYATFFLAPKNTPRLRHEPGGIVTYEDRDPFHFDAEEILKEARDRNWTARCVGEWGHPRDQQMFEFEPAR